MKLLVTYFALWGAALHADSLAMSGFEGCTGPDLDRNAALAYAVDTCHEDGLCSLSDAEDARTRAVLFCFHSALDICTISRDANICVDALSAALNDRTMRIYADFPDSRIRSAMHVQDVSQAKRLADDLMFRDHGAASDCSIPVLDYRTGDFSLTETTICEATSSLKEFYLARSIARRTVELEALDN